MLHPGHNTLYWVSCSLKLWPLPLVIHIYPNLRSNRVHTHVAPNYTVLDVCLTRFWLFSHTVGPLSPTIHRGLEWPQFLNSLSVFSLIVCLLVCSLQIFSFFIVQYSTV